MKVKHGNDAATFLDCVFVIFLFMTVCQIGQVTENLQLRENVTSLKVQVSSLSDKGRKGEDSRCRNCLADLSSETDELPERFISSGESHDGDVLRTEFRKSDSDVSLKAQVLMQVIFFKVIAFSTFIGMFQSLTGYEV